MPSQMEWAPCNVLGLLEGVGSHRQQNLLTPLPASQKESPCPSGPPQHPVEAFVIVLLGSGSPDKLPFPQLQAYSRCSRNAY